MTTTGTSAEEAVRALVARYDADVLPLPPRPARVRLGEPEGERWDVVLDGDAPRVEAPGGGRPDTTITAPRDVWDGLAEDARRGLDAFQAGRLTIRGNLHLGIGLLSATGAGTGEDRLRFRTLETPMGAVSAMEAGTGEPVLLLHGLGATKASFLPSVAALAGEGFRAVAVDLPGFGDSVKPFPAKYDPAFFARATGQVLDALDLDAAHLVGNSLGGRIALEVAFRAPERARRLVLLAPSLAWLRSRPWAWPLRLVRPELGIIQPAPRPVVEAIVRRVVPGSRSGWTAAGVDEFLRSYLTPRGRAAFYIAARHIYLEHPQRFWARLERLEHEALFVWGSQDTLVPLAFRRHVERAAPGAEHLELDCGHVPQLERPRATHEAMAAFLRR